MGKQKFGLWVVVCIALVAMVAGEFIAPVKLFKTLFTKGV